MPSEQEAVADRSGFSGLEYVVRGWMLLSGLLAVSLTASWTFDEITRWFSPEDATLGTPPVFRLDLNSASAAQLRALPRVGVRLADRIVQFRRERGPFRHVHDLQAVNGIGPTTVRRLRPMLYVDANNVAASAENPDPRSRTIHHLSGSRITPQP